MPSSRRAAGAAGAVVALVGPAGVLGPVRTLLLPRLNEASLGELLMHFMLETIIAARLIGVDAFDQPAVEEGKVLAKQYLAQG